MAETRRHAFRALTLVLTVLAALAIAPFWAPLVLAAWLADLLAPLVRRFQRVLGGARRGAAAIVVLLAILVLAPAAALGVEIVSGVRDLVAQLHAALEGQGTFAAVLLDGRTPNSASDWLRFVTRDPSRAWHTVIAVAQASTWFLLSLFVFVTALYDFCAHGVHNYRWLARNAPIPQRAFTRFARAFRETGRGIIIGGGGTALVQGTVATITYVALGVPRAWLLGPLTAIAALVPAIGTGLVWIPLAIELALTGNYARAIAIVIMGAGVISVIDNFVRPIFMRFGKLKLPTLVVLVSMLGGIAAFGAWGALLGPLAVRMVVEALEILRDEPTSVASLLRVDSKRFLRSPDRRAL
jgi:predicted PurR-regulated permease PerM